MWGVFWGALGLSPRISKAWQVESTEAGLGSRSLWSKVEPDGLWTGKESSGYTVELPMKRQSSRAFKRFYKNKTIENSIRTNDRTLRFHQTTPVQYRDKTQTDVQGCFKVGRNSISPPMSMRRLCTCKEESTRGGETDQGGTRKETPIRFWNLLRRWN